jgi:hypothetical protein
VRRKLTMISVAAKRAVFLVSSLALTVAGLGPAGAQQAPGSTPAPHPSVPKAIETPKAGGTPKQDAAKLTPIKIRGSVKKVVDGGLVLADRKGGEITLFVEPTSTLKRRSQEGEASSEKKKWVDITMKDLRVGDALVVQYVEMNGKKLVRSLRAQASDNAAPQSGAKSGTAPKP